jgi:hypothetical protein
VLKNRWIFLKKFNDCTIFKERRDIAAGSVASLRKTCIFLHEDLAQLLYIWKNCGLMRKMLKDSLGNFYLRTELRRNLDMNCWTSILFTAGRWDMKLILLKNKI